jgi:glycosyltransferase involved in cell wall biosynthesis
MNAGMKTDLMRTDMTTDYVEVSELRRHLKGLKICRISTVPFAMAIHLKSQVEYLRDIGMLVTLVSSEGPEWSRINAGQGLSIEIINIPRSLKPWQDLIALIKLAHLFLTHHFDIVHSITPKAGLLTALTAFAARVPIRLHTFTGQPWVTLQGPMRWISRRADRVIGVLNTKCYADSDSQAQFLIREGIISSRNIAVISRGAIAGVDLTRFSADHWSLPAKQKIRQSLSIAKSSKVIVFVGRITIDKGIVELISAFHELKKMNDDLHLLLVGPQDSDCGGASSLDLNDAGQCAGIHCVGYTECPEKYLAISDIFCLPSYREGFPTVIIEAAAMGLPTVGTKIYGLTDAVVDGETGILVPPRDKHALFEALKRLLDHPEEIERMGSAAKQRCFEYFETNKISEKVAEEYLNILRLKGHLPS